MRRIRMSRRNRRFFSRIIVLTCLSIITIILLFTGVDSNVDAYQQVASTKQNTKEAFAKEFVFVVDNSGGSKDATGASGNSDFLLGESVGFNVEDIGSLITNTNVNKYSAPLYDGFTMQGTFYDTDYSKFWNASGALHGLGDFTNTDAKNSISNEFTASSFDNISLTGIKSNIKLIMQYYGTTVDTCNGVYMIGDRFAVALPAGALATEEDMSANRDKILDYNNYSSTLDGTKAETYLGGLLGDKWIGTCVDCVLDNGVVIPMVVIDMKAIHYGTATNGDFCQDNLLEGYGHWRGYSENNLSYVSILEVGTTDKSVRGTEKETLCLKDSKIVGFRVYEDTIGKVK